MIDRYSGRDLVRYLGSESSAVGFGLFALGAAGLLISVIMATTIGLRDLPEGLLAVPAWSLVAAPLGLVMRRGAPRRPLLIFARVWLAAALLAMFLGSNFR